MSESILFQLNARKNALGVITYQLLLTYLSSGMRTLKTVFGMVSDWSVVKWSVLIGREQLSRDQVERFDLLIKKALEGLYGHRRCAVIGLTSF